MKRTATIILLILICTFPVLFSGCTEEVDYSTFATAGQLQAASEKIKNLETNYGDAVNRIKALESKGTQTVDLSAYPKKNEVPQALLDNINNAQKEALKTTLDITGSNPSTNPGTTPGNTQTTYNDGKVGYIFWPLSSTHDAPTYGSNTATSQVNFVMRVYNGTTQYQYVKMGVNFSTNTAVNVSLLELQMGTFNSPLTFLFNPAIPANNVTSILAISNGGGNTVNGEIQIQPGGYVDLNCWLRILTSTGATWTMSVIPSSHT